jgi:branched-chain amino acid aminotransferase
MDDPEAGKNYAFTKDGEAGPVSKKLYETLRGIQYGEISDPYGWTTVIE